MRTPLQETPLYRALANMMLGDRIPLDIVKASTGEMIIAAGRKITKGRINHLIKNRNDYELDPSPYRSKIRMIIDRYPEPTNVAETS